ncbi:conjugal transfer protein TraN [Vibrio splendidus]|uniref:conjugal transfer protein TraN n=1 Tax=Vibrio splendidus TaxID=29497 RepID=UPI003D0E7CE2
MRSTPLFLTIGLSMLWCAMSSLTHATGLSDINADEVLNSQCKDSACTAQAKHPAQTRYYTTSNDHLGEAQIAADKALTDAGKQQLNASDLEQQASQRKSEAEVPDLTDPALMRLSDFVQHSPTLMNGISDKYHDCKGGISYQYATQTRQCIRPTNAPIVCKAAFVQTGAKPSTATVTLQATMHLHSAKSGKADFTLPHAHMTISSVRINTVPHGVSAHTSTIHISVNGTPIGQLRRSVVYDAGFRRTYFHAVPTTFTVNQSLSGRTLSVTYSSGGRRCHRCGDSVESITVTGTWTTPIMNWRSSCHDVALRSAGCQAPAPVCTQGRATRTIAGEPITQTCWAKTQTWQCPLENTCQTLPISPLDEIHMSAGQTSCQLQGQACQTRINGVCIAQRETHRCTTKTQKDDKLVCGAPGSVVCPPNSTKAECQPPRYTTNTSMVEALKGLALQKAITDEFDPKSLTFFSGDAKMCAKGALGTFDCCSSHEGWAGKIGAHSCDADAREIAAAKSKHIAIKVGTFCAKKVLGACLRRKESYCLYSSKVARIATTGALAQIGKRLGSPKHPVCRGLTQEDFATLDFSKMDFSELASDMKAPIIPNTDALQSKFKDFDSSTFENHP